MLDLELLFVFLTYKKNICPVSSDINQLYFILLVHFFFHFSLVVIIRGFNRRERNLLSWLMLASETFFSRLCRLQAW